METPDSETCVCCLSAQASMFEVADCRLVWAVREHPVAEGSCCPICSCRSERRVATSRFLGPAMPTQTSFNRTIYQREVSTQQLPTPNRALERGLMNFAEGPKGL